MTNILLSIVLLFTCLGSAPAQKENHPLQVGDADLVSDLSWSPRNDLILTSSGDDDSLRLWDVSTGKVLWQNNVGFLQDDLELYWIRHSAWTNHQKFIVTGNDNGKIQLWEAATGKLLWNIKAHRDQISALAISPDANFIVSSSDAENLKAELKVWEFASGNLIRDLSANQEAISAIEFIDNNRFRVGNSLCQVATWSIANPKPISTKQITPCSIVLQKYGWFVYSPHFTFLAAQSQKLLLITNIKTGRVFRRIPREENSPRVSFSEDEKSLVLPNSETIDLYANRVNRYDELDDGVLNNDGSMIAALPSYRADGVQIFDTTTGTRRAWLVGHPGIIKSLAFSHEGSRFASGSADRIVRIWANESKKIVFSLKGHTDDVGSVEFGEDDKTLTSQSENETIVWDAQSGVKIKETKTGRSFPNNNLTLSPSGKLALIEEAEKPFRLVDARTDQTIREFVFMDQLDNLVFCPDEQHFLAKPWWAGWQLWSLESNQPIREFDVGYSSHNRVAFHPNGKTFITGGGGQNIFMFDLESGKTIWSLFPIDQQGFEVRKVAEARRVASLNRKKENERLADIENEPYKDKVYITFDHYGDMTDPGQQRMIESDEPKKSRVKTSATAANAVWLRLHNDSPLPIEIPTQSMYLPNRKCFVEFSNGKRLFGLCDNREISIWHGLEDKSGQPLPYGLDFGSSTVLLPKKSVLFAVPREILSNSNAIRFSFTFQKANDKGESDNYGPDQVLRFSESDLPRQ